MIYGIDQNVLPAPFSLIVSLILAYGVYSVGSYIQNLSLVKNAFNTTKRIKIFLSPIVGIYFLVIPPYLAIIFEFNSNIILKFVSSLLIISALSNFRELFVLFSLFKNFYKKNKNFLLNLIIVIFLLLFLVSSSIITHADALDYHFLGALNLLQLGHFNKEILPMHLNLVSIGEIIIAIGLAVKAEQFLDIIQYLSLFSLLPFFLKDKKTIYFLIFILTCPITFFLLSATKPQLLFSITSLLIFIFFTKYAKNINIDKLKKIIPIIIIILYINSLAKYSFHLSSFILGTYLLLISYQKKILFYTLKIVFIIFLILYLPYLLFKHQNFNTGILELFLSPLPLNIYGYQSLQSLIGGGKLSIIDIFLPESLSVFTTTYGPLLFLIMLMLNKKVSDYKSPLFLIFIFVVSIFLFGSNLSRFLYEGFLWLVFLVSIIVNYKKIIFRFFSKMVYFQAFLMIVIYILFIVNIFPGSVSAILKKDIMRKNANGYYLAEWTNKKLARDDVLLSSHRSIALFKNKTFSDIFTWHIDLHNPNSRIYIENLKQQKINRILFYENDKKKYLYGGCVGNKLYFKENVGRHVGRNPFNKKSFYSAWIYEFKYQELPNCLNSK